MKHNLHNNRNGNAAIAVILLLLIAGAAAWWFLFRTPAGPIPSGESKALAAGAGSGSRSSTGTGGAATQMDTASSIGSQVSSGSDLPGTDPANIDWNARHSELKQKYSDEFSEPVIGMKTKILLASGTAVEGTINDLSKDAITLRIVGTGKATYNRSQLSPQSQLLLFKDVFAEYSAQKKVADEKSKAQSAVPAPVQ